MSRAGFHIGASSSDVAIGAALIAVIALGVGLIGWVTPASKPIPVVNHDGTQLGTWYNMPSSCPSQDACMLFGNQSLVQILPFDGKLSAGASIGSIAAYLSIGCLRGSGSTNDPYLELQYALYSGQSAVTGGIAFTNSTNWQNISRVYINDNGTYTGCDGPTNLVGVPQPAVLTGAVDLGLSLNASSIGWVFRVLGFNGGGQGDNPRFTFINIELENLVKRLLTISVFTPTTTSFQYVMEVSIPFTSSTAVQFQWIADNITTGGCGIGSTATFHCWESGTGACTFTLVPGTGTTAAQCPQAGANTVTFGTAFSVAANVKAIAVTKNNLGAVETPFGVIPLFTSQPVTV